MDGEKDTTKEHLKCPYQDVKRAATCSLGRSPLGKVLGQVADDDIGAGTCDTL